MTDPADLPAEKTTYALRDIEHLKHLARGHGHSIGAYAEALLDNPLPWTKMRQVYALLGLVKKWGLDRVESACARALEAEALSVPLIGRMIERALENDTAEEPLGGDGRARRAVRSGSRRVISGRVYPQLSTIPPLCVSTALPLGNARACRCGMTSGESPAQIPLLAIRTSRLVPMSTRQARTDCRTELIRHTAQLWGAVGTPRARGER